jgi:radical SAM superfamily enzyme YgiQ (UPF0313 family)
MKNIDLMIVHPGVHGQLYGKLVPFSAIEPPIWAGLTAAFVRSDGNSVKIIDAEAESWTPEYTAEKVAEYNPRLVSIIVLGANSCFSTPKMTATIKLVRSLKERRPDLRIMLGGIHPSALPERTLQETGADFIAVGEGFYTTRGVLDLLRGKVAPESIPGLWYREGGVIKSTLPAKPINPDELPMTAWDLLPMGKYRACNWHCFDNIDKRQPYAVIYTSYGCPFSCRFCNIHMLYGGLGIRFRRTEKILEEIDLLVRNYKIRNIRIFDELFALREDRVVRICDLIIERGYDLNMWTYARVDTVNESMLKKMKQAGINWVAYGVEAASAKVRGGVGKKFDNRTIKRAVETAHAAGIHVIADYMFGLPGDDFDTMQQTLDMAKELNCEYANFYTAIGYPGSQLYEDAMREGIKLPQDWGGYGQYSEDVIPTTKLPPADVLRFRDKAFREYFSNPKYLEMIANKFGQKVVDHIREMLKHEVKRKYAPSRVD